MTDERPRILTSAFEEFALNGFERSSLEAVAARADVDAAVVRHHFVNKERLFREVVEDKIVGMIGSLQYSIGEIEDPRQYIRQMVIILDEIIGNNPLLLRFLMLTTFEKGEEYGSFLESSMFPTDILDRLDKMIADGQLRGPDSLSIAFNIESLVIYSHLCDMMLGECAEFPEVKAKFANRLDSILDMLEYGLFTSRIEDKSHLKL